MFKRAIVSQVKALAFLVFIPRRILWTYFKYGHIKYIDFSIVLVFLCFTSFSLKNPIISNWTPWRDVLRNINYNVVTKTLC